MDIGGQVVYIGVQCVKVYRLSCFRRVKRLRVARTRGLGTTAVKNRVSKPTGMKGGIFSYLLAPVAERPKGYQTVKRIPEDGRAGSDETRHREHSR